MGLAACVLVWAAADRAVVALAQEPDTEWPAYGNDAGGSRYSPLAQIDRRNVDLLQPVWSFRTGESGDELTARHAASETTPLLIEGTLYVSTPLGKVIAVDPVSGTEIWRNDAGLERGRGISRGLAAWVDSDLPVDAECRVRILHTVPDARLRALDGRTGESCPDFGNDGVIDLTRGIRIRDGGGYRVTSPPAVVGEVVVVGSAIGGNGVAVETRGIVRGFDVRSGRARWRWDPLLREARIRGADAEIETVAVRAGSANAWAPLSVDEERDLVFLPTSSASPDHYGGRRPGDNLYSDSVVALRGATGELVWYFQVVHHDLWDYDVATQPSLITYRQGPEDPGTPAVVVGSKTGHVFVLDRETGEPLIPVEEGPAPGDGAPGEWLSSTQPVPTAPPSLVSGRMTPGRVFGLSGADRRWCREQVRDLRDEGLFTPPSVQGSLAFPGEVGGFNWGGLSWYPRRDLLIGNTSRLAAALYLVPRSEYDAELAEEWRANNPHVTIGLQRGTRFVMRRELLIAPGGAPCNRPPWGQLGAVDLRTGEILWQVPLGVTPEAADRPRARRWGSRNVGGALVTGGGLVFISAARDETLRAFDVETGRTLWEEPLPAGGHATPMTYRMSGRQYVVIFAGGHWDLGTTLGDHVLAWALP